MSTTDIGRRAESLIAAHLTANAYTVISQNWRTRWCEIDVIASKKNVAYFVEVKYRMSNTWGDGLDAITDKKLRQMSFAAEMWVSEHAWNGEYCLMVASVSGDPPKVAALFEVDQ